MKKLIILTSLLIFSISCDSDSEDDSEKTYSSADDFVGIWSKTSEIRKDKTYRNFQVNYLSLEDCFSNPVYGSWEDATGVGICYDTSDEYNVTLETICTNYGAENNLSATYIGDGICELAENTITECCSGLQSETLIFRSIENSDNANFLQSGYDSDGDSYAEEGTFFVTNDTTFTFNYPTTGTYNGVFEAFDSGVLSASGTTVTFTGSYGILPSNFNEPWNWSTGIVTTGTRTYIYEYVGEEADSTSAGN